MYVKSSHLSIHLPLNDDKKKKRKEKKEKKKEEKHAEIATLVYLIRNQQHFSEYITKSCKLRLFGKIIE